MRQTLPARGSSGRVLMFRSQHIDTTNMAFCLTKFCCECAKETMHTNGKCGVCEGKEARQHKEAHFARLDKMTLEERVRELENISYNRSIEPVSFDWGQPVG